MTFHDGCNGGDISYHLFGRLQSWQAASWDLWNGSSSPSGFERGSVTVQSCLSSQTLELTLRSAMPYICRLPRSIWFRTIKSGHSLVTLLMLLAESELHDTPKQKKKQKTEWRKPVVNLCRNVKNKALFRPTAMTCKGTKLQIQTPVNTALTFTRYCFGQLCGFIVDQLLSLYFTLNPVCLCLKADCIESGLF